MTLLLRSRWVWLSGAILAVTLFRLWYSTHLELVGDEAYYWLWSRHLDLCYLDKGPVIAWIITAGTGLFGQTVFGVRFFAVILSTLTGVAIYFLARRLFNDRVALWALILAAVTPLFAVGAILMTIDTPYIFFWTLAALSFWHAKDSDHWWTWILTGVLVGLGLLSKYTGAVELISFAAFCAFDPPSRRHFFKGGFWVMLLVTAIFLAVPVYWNRVHGWPTTRFLFHRGGLDAPPHIDPVNALIFLSGQAGVISPFIFLGLILVVCWPGLAKLESKAEVTYLLALFLPLFLFYFFISFQQPSQANWAAAAYIGGFILLAAKWSWLAQKKAWARWLGVAGIGVGLIIVLGLHETSWLYLPRGKDPLDRARGSRDLAAQVTELQTKTGANFVIANKYMTAALLSFYLPGQPDTFMPVSSAPYNQLILWPSYRQMHPADDAIFISDFDRLPASLKEDFARIDPLGELKTVENGRTIKGFYAFLCRRQTLGGTHTSFAGRQ
jgi:4-amino-4-deoxy-L-arabinose transferase-like glycosyltransferase